VYTLKNGNAIVVYTFNWSYSGRAINEGSINMAGWNMSNGQGMTYPLENGGALHIFANREHARIAAKEFRGHGLKVERCERQVRAFNARYWVHCVKVTRAGQ